MINWKCAVTKGCLCSDKTICQCMQMFKFKDLHSTMSFYGHCSFTYLWNMHLILHDGIHNTTVVINATRCFVYRPPVRPIVHICPSICHTGGSIKNGWWRLCNFHRTVNPYLPSGISFIQKFWRIPEGGGVKQGWGWKRAIFYSSMRRYLEKGTRLR